MSDVRLYFDEDTCDEAVIIALRSQGIDVLETMEAGQSGAADSTQLLFAADNRRTIYTLNVADFAVLHRAFLEKGHRHIGIITIPKQRYSTAGKLRCLIAFLRSTSSESLVNRMVLL